MQVEQTFTVGMQDVGMGSELSNKAIIEALSNLANYHAYTIGQSSGDEWHNHQAWLVQNWMIQVENRPRICQSYTARTWGQVYTRAHALREFEIEDEEGNICVRGTSKWVVVDVEEGGLVRLTPEIMDVYEAEPEHVLFPEFKFSRLHTLDIPVQESVLFKVPKCMIDVNGHVHNSMYLDMALEVAPREIVMASTTEVQYRKEVPANSSVLLEYGVLEGAHYVFVKSEQGDVLHAAIRFQNS